MSWVEGPFCVFWTLASNQRFHNTTTWFFEPKLMTMTSAGAIRGKYSPNASWQVRAFYGQLGVPLERSTRRILLIAVRVLRMFESDMQLAWRVRVSFLPREWSWLLNQSQETRCTHSQSSHWQLCWDGSKCVNDRQSMNVDPSYLCDDVHAMEGIKTILIGGLFYLLMDLGVILWKNHLKHSPNARYLWLRKRMIHLRCHKPTISVWPRVTRNLPEHCWMVTNFTPRE